MTFFLNLCTFFAVFVASGLGSPANRSARPVSKFIQPALPGRFLDENPPENRRNISPVVQDPSPVLTRLRRSRSSGDDLHEGSNMIKNITSVLENLLKNYENSQLPTQEKGGPTVVRTNMLIRSMGPVSELDMDYSMDCYFRQSWRDTRLSFIGPIKSLSLSIKMLERIWRPDTYFYNGKQSYVHTITVPNKLLRISQEGDILYSMRLTIKAKCPMELRNFPMDSQSCPLVLGSYAYTSKSVVYQWQSAESVTFVPGMTLSQFDLMGSPQRNLTFERRNEEYSILQVCLEGLLPFSKYSVSFNLKRNTGYFVIQVYVPCVLIVVLSWVSFWIHREATSDRVGLGITTVLTLSTISLDSRTDLPKVRYATALDWFLLMSFFYCIATLLEFAGVHYFTKVGSGEIFVDEDEWEEVEELQEPSAHVTASLLDLSSARQARRRSSLICPIYNDPKAFGARRSIAVCETREESTSTEGECSQAGPSTGGDDQPDARSRRLLGPRKCSLEVPGPDFHERLLPRRGTVEQQTQTERRVPRWRQLLYCLMGDDAYRRQRQREAAQKLGPARTKGHVNSVSNIDQAARVLFPLSFTCLNIFYWYFYLYSYYPSIHHF